MGSLITWGISAGIHVIVDEVYASSVFASELAAAAGPAQGRGLHSFPFQLNMSSSVHRITQLNS